LLVTLDASRPSASQTSHLESGEHRCVGLLAENDGQFRRADQPLALDIPAGAREHPVASSHEAREGCHRRARRDPTEDKAGSPNNWINHWAAISSMTDPAGDMTQADPF
jgi:hypothetical protein